MGRHWWTLSGKFRAFPVSEKTAVALSVSRAQSRQGPKIGPGPGGVPGSIKGDGGGENFLCTPGDAAILTLARVDKTVSQTLFFSLIFKDKLF